MRRFRGRHFLDALDYTPEELLDLIEFSLALKRLWARRPLTPFLPGSHLAMIFQMQSTRTRVSFETGIAELGGESVYLRPGEIHLGVRESIGDTARVVSEYVDVVMARLVEHSELEEFARGSLTPVISGCDATLHHPVQALTDAMTIVEECGDLSGRTMAFVGENDVMCNTTLRVFSHLGMNIRCATPPDSPLSDELRATVSANCEARGTEFVVASDPVEAVDGADFVQATVFYWDDSDDSKDRAKQMRDWGFQVGEELWKATRPDARFMHCLPARRGDEVTDEIIDSAASLVWKQAANRKHFQKGLMLALVGIDTLPEDPDMQEIGLALLR